MISKVGLSVGFVALAMGVFVARAAPATGYEVSLYAATPTATWIAFGVAIGLGVLVSLFATTTVAVRLGLGLVGATTVSVVSLPRIRGYWAYGQGDALTHLGWARQLTTGELAALELLYPGAHLVAGLLGDAGGIDLSTAMLLVIVIHAALFVTFVPLAIRVIVPDRGAVVLGTFAACFLLPVTNVSTFVDFHPFTMATFVAAFVLYALFVYLSPVEERSVRTDLVSSPGIVLVLAGCAVLFVHPMTALNTLVLLGAIAGVQYGYRRWGEGGIGAQYRPVYAPTAVLGVLFALWSLQFERVTRLGWVTLEAVALARDDPDATGAVVRDRGVSIAEVGGSLTELFVKLFAVHALFVLLTIGLVVVVFAHRLGDEDTDRDVIVTYFTYGGVVLAPLLVLHFLGDVSGFFFRHLGFGMVLVTLLGAIAAVSVWGFLDRRVGRATTPVVAVCVLVALVLSMAVVFPSPYVYQPNQHVSEGEFNGHQIAFETGDREVPYIGVRRGPGRYADAMNVDGYASGPAVAGDTLEDGALTRDRDGEYYLIVSAFVRDSETIAFNEIRYTAAGIDAIGEEPGVHHVQSNDQYDRYYVEDRGVE